MSSIYSSPDFTTSRPCLSLDGAWAFSYDPDDVGIAEGWFAEGISLPEDTAVPGCAQTQRYASARGNLRVTEVEIPEHSQTIMLKHGCLHPSWYRRTFQLPAAWQGQRIALHVGGVKPAATFWLNGQLLGETLTSRSPVRVDLSDAARCGEANTLAVRIHWPRFRLDGVYDVWQAWSGVYRSIRVEALPYVSLTDIHITPSIDPPAATIELALRGDCTGRTLSAHCEIAGDAGACWQGEAHFADGAATLQVPMPGAGLWSPNHPTLYRAKVRLFEDGSLLDDGEVRFGLREIAVHGRQVLLNGLPIFLRGGCDDHIYPETICPPADVEFFRRRIRQAKRYGFNYTKSACEIFTDEFLTAADEEGYLVCQEMPFGVLGELRAVRDDPPAELESLWKRELRAIVTADRSHPAVVAYSMCSENLLDGERQAAFRIFSRELPALTRRLNPHALVIDATAAFCFTTQTRHGRRDTDLLEDCIENAYTLAPFTGPLPIPESVDRPFLLHEWDWICGLPDPAIVARYEELPLAVVQVPEMIEAARANGLLAELPAMAAQSRKLKYALRKHAFEAAFRAPEVAGYHHWLIHDVCYCPEGVFNEFWEEPADLPADVFRGYNDDTVLVLDDSDRRSFAWGERIPLGLTIAHFGERPVAAPVLRWRLTRGQETLADGHRALRRIACGRRVHVPTLGLPRLAGDAPAQLELSCELWDGAERRVCGNRWPLWLFPPPARVTFPRPVITSLSLPAGFDGIDRPYDPLTPKAGTGVFVAHRLLDGKREPIDTLLNFVAKGGRTLALCNGDFPETYSAFYRPVPYVLGREGNMGTVIRRHPALGDFPHDGWCDLPFVPFIQGAHPLRLDVFAPTRVNPIIRSIPHPVTMTDKAYLAEIGVGRGTLLLCSLNLQSHWHTDPAARCLLHAMLAYLAGESCAPEAVVSVEALRTILRSCP